MLCVVVSCNVVWFCTAVCVVCCRAVRRIGWWCVLCGVTSFIVVGCGVLCIVVAVVYECIVKLGFLRWILVLGVCV